MAGEKGSSRRRFLKTGVALGAVAALPEFAPGQSTAAAPQTGPRVVVVGAGAFGGWTALHLRRAGARVTLLDAWGPGNARASSGGETRVIRASYGPDALYTAMAMRALELWRENQDRWDRRLFHNTGVLWLAGEKDDFEVESLRCLREANVPHEVMNTETAAARYPQIDFQGVHWVIHETEAGYLMARQACETVRDAFIAEGGTYLQSQAEAPDTTGRALRSLRLAGGRTLEADHFVFACGPWLGKLFPRELGGKVQPTRQEVFFFGTPPGDMRFDAANLPVWADNGEHFFYGIPANDGRGFKLADDTRGPAFDPSEGDRTPSAEGIAGARRYMARRFPALKDAPLLEARVCQYENSPDHHFILDRHPRAQNVWLAGGGSGHGYKMGPAVGEMLSAMVLGKRAVEPFFALKRLG